MKSTALDPHQHSMTTSEGAEDDMAGVVQHDDGDAHHEPPQPATSDRRDAADRERSTRDAYRSRLTELQQRRMPCAARRGRLVSTLFANLARGTAQVGKGYDMMALLEKKRLPDLVALTELWSRPGEKKKTDEFFQPFRDYYDIVYSQRSHSLSRLGEDSVDAPRKRDKEANGGGIALLVHKRLCVSILQEPFDVSDETRALLDGHLRTWRLVADAAKLAKRRQQRRQRTFVPAASPATRRARARSHRARGDGSRATTAQPELEEAPLKPMIITVGYAPPAGTEWGVATRPAIFQTLREVHESIQARRAHEDIFAMSFVHANAPDDGADLDLPMRSDLRPFAEVRREVEQAPAVAPIDDEEERSDGSGDAASSAFFPRRRCVGRRGGLVRRACIQLFGDGTRVLRRAFSKHQRKLGTPEGNQLIRDSANAGFVCLNGVMSHLQSSSWQNSKEWGASKCPECAAGRKSACLVTAQSRKKRPTSSDCCARRLQMKSHHDLIFVFDSLVWDALTSPTGGADLLQFETRKTVWSTPQDHGVTTARVFVGRVAPPAVDDGLDSAPNSNSRNSNLPSENSRRKKFPRFALPFELLAKHIELKQMAEHRDELAAEHTSPLVAAFDTSVPIAPLIDAECDALNSVLLKSQAVALATRARLGRRDAPLPEALQQLKAEAKRCIRAVQRASRAYSSGRTPERASAAKAACKAQRAASKRLHDAEDVHYAATQSRAARCAPKKAWKNHSVTDFDPGAPEAVGAPLLYQQNDSNGRLKVLGDAAKARANVVANRTKILSVNNIGAVCEKALEDACAELHVVNVELLAEREMMRRNADSAVAISARDALAPIAEEDARRGVQRNADAMRAYIAAYRIKRSAQSTRGQQVQRDFPAACAALNRDISTTEILHRCNEFEDVCAGTDGVAPGTLRMQDDGAMLHRIWRLFLSCQATGTQPNQWDEHLCTLLYKGKGTDPYCLDNYRGLGIDHALGKLWALVWVERIEVFLRATNGLSALQGGFQRQRGPPEQAFTLAETVRAAIRENVGVHLCFIDVKEAYDSVLHPILWARCIEKGIGGTCLAALQGIYRAASAVVSIGGELLDAVAIRRGVLQGSPLSPVLFNIYLDGTIRALHEMGVTRIRAGLRPIGVSLPRVCPTGPLRSAAVLRPHNQDEYLPCLYFADDGLLLEHDLKVLQLMLDESVLQLAAVGLRINAKKTKWMFVPPANVRRDTGYFAKLVLTNIRLQLRKSPLRVGDEPVELVDEFDYLGVRMSWQWNWTAAWKLAQKRARACYFGARRGGWQHRAGSMAAQLTYAHNKIFCHFNHVAAITGAGGSKSSAQWRNNASIVEWTLRDITGLHAVSGTALEIESGVHDQETRIDVLLTRMWCKFLTMPRESTFVRAMCLSMSTLSPKQRANPAGSLQATNRIHKQPWAQQLLASTARLGLKQSDVLAMRHSLVALQAFDVGQQCWKFVARSSSDGGVPGSGNPVGAPAAVSSHHQSSSSNSPASSAPHALLRLVATPYGVTPVVAARLIEGVSCWQLPAGTLAGSALCTWTPQLKEATYCALRTLGNACRQTKVRAFLAEKRTLVEGAEHGDRLRMWASSIGFSFMQPYFHLDDVKAARRLAEMRFDRCPTEDFLRHRPFYGGADGKTLLPRLQNPGDRTCYVCDGSVEAHTPHVNWNDDLPHALLDCANPRVVSLRNEFQAAATGILSETHSRELAARAGCDAGHPPDLSNKSALFTVMRLCIGVGVEFKVAALPPLSRVGMPRAAALKRELAARRVCDAPRHQHDHAAARGAAAYVQALTHDWCDIMREPRRQEIPSQSPGARLALLSARFAKRLFDTRAALLAHSSRAPGFLGRVRDPPAAIAGLFRPRAAVRVDAPIGGAAGLTSSVAAPPLQSVPVPS